MSPDDRWRISHMIEAAEEARAFVQGRQRADLDQDRMLCLALTRAVEIVGEAAAQVSTAMAITNHERVGTAAPALRRAGAPLLVPVDLVRP